jgi:hypothetical protein
MTKLWREVRDFALLLVRIVWRLGVSILGLVLVLVACRVMYLTYAYHFGFDQARWAASAAALHTDPEDSFDNSRQSMVADVLAHELRPGMSRAAVRALLGPADADNDGAAEALEWRYETGWSGIDPTALVIEFSNQGTVVRSYMQE